VPAVDSSSTGNTADVLDRAVAHLLSLQQDNGCWEGEMVWCTMILSQFVIVQHIVGHSWDQATQARIVRHYEVTRRPDGSWGLHPESQGYVFTTTLAYVALRLLGLDPNHPLVASARDWLHGQAGGVLAIPTWGKCWLALLDLYGYEGVNPCPLELFLLPRWFLFHPWRYYCHTRYIYLAIAYLYSRRFQADLGPIAGDLRRELYGVAYDGIDFAAHRHDIAPTDLHVRPGWVLRLSSHILAAYERRPVAALRQRALDDGLERVLYEQRTSRYQALSPVNGLLNCLVLWSRDPNHPDLRPSLAGLESWKWEDEDEGRRYAGARSQTWDTAFAMQALLANPALARQAETPLRRAYAFLRQAQRTEEIPAYRREGRDPTLGGWCFSDGRHCWPVSDCTAEALSATLVMQNTPGLHLSAAERIPEERLYQAVEFILRRQNADGGFGTYERRRGSRLLEILNPSEMYGSCMTEGSYLECTGSSLSALAHFRAAYPDVLRRPIEAAVARGTQFLRRKQRPDGSYAGFWGIHFTYGIFHVVRGLHATGVAPTDAALGRATSWLVSKQRADGGWGEHYTSCLRDCYVEHPQSQVVMTSWALLALLHVLEPQSEPIRRGLAWLRGRQHANGSWPQEAVTGVFFGTAMLDYRLYKSYFPLWALALASKRGSDQGV
jgi:2,3-oxidosqualene cyclase